MWSFNLDLTNKNKTYSTDNHHCKNCMYYNEQETLCKKYRMLVRPSEWCKSCTADKREDDKQ